MSEASITAQIAAQLRHPNFLGDDGQFYLVRCFVCDSRHGRENYLPSVALGTCAWCGWGMPEASQKDCETCEHKTHADGGHCYMFKSEPEGDRCGQYKADQ